ncbi:MAG: alpha-2-macroglobulin domain protein, partial [Myxococcaceae bacterium]|nr:alpha-2-macroglobulin domain protein [Myxococcaceae bacterium]
MGALSTLIASLTFLLFSVTASAQTYAPADLGQHPVGGGVKILPEDFLRGYDPVTVYFPDDVVAAKANADDGPKRLKMVPDWPGAYVWVDKRTLQFRPAEPWPALARFQFVAGSTTRTLTTMMSAPSAMSPAPGSEGLKPFRVVTLTFPQSLALPSLKKMLNLEVRDLPGLADSPRRKINTYAVAPLPRASQRDPATYALTLEDDVPEGKQLVVTLSLALGNEGTTLWTGRASTRTAFSLTGVRCGSNAFSLLGGASTPKDLALACGNRGDAPQLEFSATVSDLTLTSLRKLVRLEPAVADLHFSSSGSRVQLAGRFVPDTLYKLTLGPAPITDDSGRTLREVKPAEVFFHLGWKSAFLKWNQATAIVEAKGPRMLPITGYGDARADVRVFRIDALHNGLWPYPSSPIVIDEQSAPPFPGEEPEVPAMAGYVDASALQKHIRLLGTPLVSKVIDLPLSDKGNTTHFGIDLKNLLDPVVGANRPGTYLVGLRRLTGRPERSWMRVQVTNLTLTSAEERNKAILYVRTLDGGDAVKGATVTLEGRLVPPFQPPKGWDPKVTESFTTDGEGRVTIPPRPTWETISRISVQSGDDALVLDPRESPPRFANNHWSSSGDWLHWLTSRTLPTPANEGTLGFLFSERAIYKPGEAVFLKGFARNKLSGELRLPTAQAIKTFGCIVTGPDGQQWRIPLTPSPLGGFAGTFQEASTPTGTFTAALFEADPSRTIATRQFKIEAYRVPTFEVQLTGRTKVPLDAAFKVKAVARYYAGGNVGNQPIAWSVTQRPYHWMPKGLEGYLFASSTQFARPGSARAPDVTTQSGELDDTGASDITINPQLDLDGSARVYTFQATVTGPDEQPITAQTEVKALPPFVLGMKLPRYLEKATTLEPAVVAVGVDDKLVKGQEVRVRLFRRVWHSNLRETSFATGKAKYVTEQEDLQVAEKTVTTTDKPLPLSFEIKDAGVYVVELFSRDKLGRVQTMQADLYIGGQTPLAWNKSKEGVFELKPDKKSYAPGETAHLVVQSPYTTARALVVVEEPTGNTYTWQAVNGGKAVIDVRITDKYVPNLPVHVVLMRGRLGEGKTDDARYKPASAAASVDLEVEPTKNLVKVEINHAETAKPGTKQDFTILLTDDQKKPVGGEVTFWLVDEAVLSLAREATLDPLSELIRRNSRGTSIRDTRNLVVGRVSELEEDPGGDGGDDEAGEGKRLVRKNFKTVPFYVATLSVPPSGKLVVPVTLSDDLTNFKVRVVAVAGAQRFGFKQTTLKVRLPVLVQPQLPRFVRVGDRFWPGGVARLVEGAEGPASIEIKVTGAVEGTPLSSSKIELKNSKAQSVLTPVTVKSVPTTVATWLTVRMDVTRLSDKAGDAFEVKLPLLPDRTVEKFSWIEKLQPGKTQMKAFPEPARPGTVTQSFVLTSQPGVLELASGLEYLSEYPHGCLEQRMS